MGGKFLRAMPGGTKRRGPMHRNSEARALKNGLVMIVLPSRRTKKVAWPSHVIVS